MAEKKIFFTKCRLLPNGCALDEEYEITLGAPEIDYFESIESPTISMSLRFLDVDQVIGRKGITGGELIEVTVKDGDEDEFKITKDHKMMLNSVVDMNTQTSFQEATLEFVSQETIINETSRLNKKFTGNISQIVEDILTKDKKGILTKKKVFGPKTETTNYDFTIEEDRTTNSYSFVGNLKRPFDTIQWLCPKSQASNKSFGFLFFENLDGYHFRSIEKLLEQEPSFTYIQTDKPYDKDTGNFKILQNKVTQTNDIFQNMRRGMYANRTIYVDILNGTKDIVDFKETPFMWEVDNNTAFKVMGTPINTLSKMQLIPINYPIEMTTVKQNIPSGYFYLPAPNLDLNKTVDITDDDHTLFTQFQEWVQNTNNWVSREWENNISDDMSQDDKDIVDNFIDIDTSEGTK